MKSYIFLFFMMTMLLSCHKKNTISDVFNCDVTSQYSNTKEYNDVLKHFKINIPKTWNTSLYYDEYQSKLYSADTTKQLSETYITDITWHQGNLKFNKDFENKIKQIVVEKNKLEIVKSGYSRFLKHKCFYNLAVGKSKNITYHYFQIYLRYKNDEYYTFATKIYGDDYVTERICQSISLFENLSFIK